MKDHKKEQNHLSLVSHYKLQDEELTDHDINLNRINALIDSLLEYDNPEDGSNFLLHESIIGIIKAKQMYLAWLEDEY